MNASTPQNEVEEQYMAEMRERVLAGETFVLEMDLPCVAAVLAMLQLALRHPGTAGMLAAQTARRVACSLEQELGRTPAIAEAARRGWLEEYDLELGR